ncbi:MAG: helix-turn-helix domain-containing protein [Candidatus Bathyarchaeia archaeon]
MLVKANKSIYTQKTTYPLQEGCEGTAPNAPSDKSVAISAETWRALKTCGLTGQEIQAYLALLEKGSLNASEVSREAGVPYSKIYEVLGSLERKGWIETEAGRPNLYYAKPPVEAVETTRLRMADLIRASGKQIVGDLQPIYEKKGSRERPDIWIVRGEFNILARVGEVCSRAIEELLVAIPAVSKEISRMLESSYLEVRRGVRVHILAKEGADPGLIEGLRRLGEVRLRDQMFGGGVISDAKEVLLILEGDKGQGPALAIWSSHIGLARFAKNYFEYLWKDAGEYQEPRNA